MSAMVRLGPGRSGGPLGIPSEGLEHTILTPDMRSIRFRAGDLEKLTGRDEELEDLVVPANTAVLIHTPVPLKPRKYDVEIGVNPALLKVGQVVSPGIMSAIDVCEHGATIQFKAFKKVDLAEFSYIFNIRMID